MIVDRRALLLPATLVVLLAGCIPFPHHDRLTPAITGVARSGDTPLGDAPVLLDTTSGEGDCPAPALATRTDAQGAFTIGPAEEFRWIVFLLGEPYARWTLCVDAAGGRRALLRQHGIGAPPVALDVACDIAGGDVRLEAFGYMYGKCRRR